jgi:hypothetical protein
MPDMGRVNGEAYPLWAELGVPKMTDFLQGHPRTRLPRLEGAGGKVERTWLVRFSAETPKSLELKVFAPAVGAVARTVEIQGP